MKIFPTNNYSFKLVGEPIESLERLKRRTLISESLSSKITDKSFIGIIGDNNFSIISSEIGRGAFCVLTGEIISKNGIVKIEINKPFQILSAILLCLPIAGFIFQLFSQDIHLFLLFLIVALGQILIIRFLFIGVAFKRFSKNSLNRLTDVLDIESLEKK
ncbi:hypothetical protein HNP37_003437 [Flavobacterium nitrogenifigens]|uniref:Uncharacterized protein n=2 Tax=Flavobacterium TaxID=237 RepID=A0A7W7IZF5_9FLAO|nr:MULTISPECIES: hypothetical protein [Flavobacterium]MBB4803362.1 hypothetical protein [Flavobacterium nitrogenifigens]MBB6388320.1 hypothetical protein [Flavobacterium notoginsengisoli]